MTAIATLRSFPKNPVDGQSFIDSSGEVYFYNVFNGSWFSVGSQVEAGIVNSQKSGLLSPDIAEFLANVRDAHQNGSLFSLNLFRGNNYWWFLRSRDGRMRFSVEGDDCLRAEVNRPYVLNQISMDPCEGNKGLVGNRGEEGAPGIPGPLEPFLSVQVNGNLLTFEAKVEVPLETPISIRFFQEGAQLLEIKHNIFTGENTFISEDSFDGFLDANNTEVSFEAGTLAVSAALNTEWGSGWQAKARQEGPKGRPGEDGDPFIGLTDFTIADPAMRSNYAVGTMRNEDRNLFIAIDRAIINFPVDSLIRHPSSSIEYESDFTENVLNKLVRFGAAQPTLSNSKSIWRWEFEPIFPEQDELDLPDWTPDPSCLREITVKMKWWEEVDEETFEVCEQPKITIADPIPKKCCQEDFFFCPNIGDCPTGQNESGFNPMPELDPMNNVRDILG